MQVKINETGEIKALTIIDEATGCEWTKDLLGNCDVHTDANEDMYHMDAADYEWWLTYINGYVATKEDIMKLAEAANKDPYKIQQQVFEYMGENDMENERGRAMQFLAELADEYGVTWNRA